MIMCIIVGIIFAVIIIVSVIAAVADYIDTHRERNHQQRRNITNHNPVSNYSPNTQSSDMPMIYFANDNHNSHDKEYRFQYKKVGNSWRAYILKMPNLRGRDSSLSKTHRHTEGGKYWVCWDTPVATLKDMQAISKVWADNIQEYIATGRTF